MLQAVFLLVLFPNQAKVYVFGICIPAPPPPPPPPPPGGPPPPPPPQPDSARSTRRLTACSGVSVGGGKDDDGSDADRALAGFMKPTVTRGAARIGRPAAGAPAGSQVCWLLASTRIGCPDAGAGSAARTRSGGAGRVLHEGGVLLEEGRAHFG